VRATGPPWPCCQLLKLMVAHLGIGAALLGNVELPSCSHSCVRRDGLHQNLSPQTPSLSSPIFSGRVCQGQGGIGTRSLR